METFPGFSRKELAKYGMRGSQSQDQEGEPGGLQKHTCAIEHLGSWTEL